VRAPHAARTGLRLLQTALCSRIDQHTRSALDTNKELAERLSRGRPRRRT
jgi:hypothetical protein